MFSPNGFRRFLFQVISLIENGILVITGSLCMQEYSIKEWSSKIAVIVIIMVLFLHLLAIFLKCVYYAYIHPWMNLSKAYKKLTGLLDWSCYIIVALIAIGIIPVNYYLNYYCITSTKLSNTITVIGIWILVSVSPYLLK